MVRVNFLDKRKAGAYWANTSSNGLVGKLIREGSPEVKKNAVWSLLLAGGYLKVMDYKAYMTEYDICKEEYELALTNFETRIMFVNMVKG